MRILFAANFSGIGGAERSLMPLARELQQRGHELTLFLVDTPFETAVFKEFAGVVDLPDTSRGQKARRPMRLLRLLLEIRRTDLVVATSELTVTYVAWVLAALWRKPLVADVQVHLSSWIRDNCHPVHRLLSRWIYPRLRGIRCVSYGVAEDLRAQFSVRADQVVVIPVPFDLEELRRAKALTVEARDEPIFLRPVIVGAGRLTSQKRFDVAIRTFQILHRHLTVDANLLILGEGEDRHALEQQIADLGLADRVFLPGHVVNLAAYLGRAAVFLLSSDYEGLPRVLIEALAVGCPVVATDCPSGPFEILDGGKGGLLAPCGDAEQLATALAQVLTDTALSEKLRRVGSSRVEAFDTTATAQTYSEWIRRMKQNGFGPE